MTPIHPYIFSSLSIYLVVLSWAFFANYLLCVFQLQMIPVASVVGLCSKLARLTCA